MTERVVLVDEQNNVLGTAPKLAAHNSDTPLHRAFSVFLFNSRGELLLQQRALHKKTWPGVWSNSCCGHPGLGESVRAAAHRRLSRELGFIGLNLDMVLPNYRYRYEKDGIVENEICPVLVGFTNLKPAINPEEVANIHYINWYEFLEKLNQGGQYSPWCREEAFLLNQSPYFQELFKDNTRGVV
jgi:isopentenyl-diphosphate Delta-isomerase